jgi:hypothetical protein
VSHRHHQKSRLASTVVSVVFGMEPAGAGACIDMRFLSRSQCKKSDANRKGTDGLPVRAPHAFGVGGACAGTITNTGTAESGSSHGLNDIKGWTIRSSPGDMSCTNEPKSKKAGTVVGSNA